MSIEYFDDKLVITRSWLKKRQHLGTIGVGLFITLIFLFPAITDARSPAGIFLTPSFWMVLYFFGSALYGFVNKTVVTVSSRQLTIKHRPLPWPGNRQLSPDDIERV